MLNGTPKKQGEGKSRKRKERNKTALVLKVCVFFLFNLSFLQKGRCLVDPQASKNVPLPPKQKQTVGSCSKRNSGGRSFKLCD